MRISDWSSDVCSSDLRPARARHAGIVRGKAGTVRRRNHGHPIRETHDPSVAGTCRTAAVASLTLSHPGRHAPLKRRPLDHCSDAYKATGPGLTRSVTLHYQTYPLASDVLRRLSLPKQNREA